MTETKICEISAEDILVEEKININIKKLVFYNTTLIQAIY
jgi:hypothetical protein